MKLTQTILKEVGARDSRIYKLETELLRFVERYQWDFARRNYEFSFDTPATWSGVPSNGLAVTRHINSRHFVAISRNSKDVASTGVPHADTSRGPVGFFSPFHGGTVWQLAIGRLIIFFSSG